MPRHRATAHKMSHQLKVTLQEISPPIWRRVMVASNITLHRLHWIIQVSMGWTNSHLHQFIVDGQHFSQLDFGLEEAEIEVKNEKTARLGRLVTAPRSKFIYQYDFGDSWYHEILVEQILTPDPKMTYPVCVAGKRACPPEDCGGIGGYERFLDAIRHPDHPEHDEMLTWVGGVFDSEACDINRINRELWGRARSRGQFGE